MAEAVVCPTCGGSGNHQTGCQLLAPVLSREPSAPPTHPINWRCTYTFVEVADGKADEVVREMSVASQLAYTARREAARLFGCDEMSVAVEPWDKRREDDGEV